MGYVKSLKRNALQNPATQAVRIKPLLVFYAQRMIRKHWPKGLPLLTNPTPTPTLLPRLRTTQWMGDQMWGWRTGRGMNFHLQTWGGGDSVKMPVWGGGNTLEPCEKKERQDTEAIFIDIFYLTLWYSFPSPHHTVRTPYRNINLCEHRCRDDFTVNAVQCVHARFFKYTTSVSLGNIPCHHASLIEVIHGDQNPTQHIRVGK